MKTINHRERRERRGRKEPGRRTLFVVNEMFSDPITRAIARNREAVQAGVPERETVWDHVFRCVCCGKMRGDSQRREPWSEVCALCVAEAGFLN